MADSHVHAAVETVTPKKAETWLGKNTTNRNIRSRVVESYARDMRNGQWQLTGEPVKFAIDGRLLDGQHRLHAVIEAGKPIDMLVVRGLLESTQSVMDSGAKRTAGDALRLRGEAQYTAIAAAARLAIAYEANMPLEGRNVPATHTEVLNFVDEHPDLREAVLMAKHHKNGIDMPPAVLSLGIWVLSSVDMEDCNQFVAQLAEKTHLAKGHAILALITRLGEVRRNGRRATANDYLSLLFRAWNYWREGQKVDSLPLRKAGGEVQVPVPR